MINKTVPSKEITEILTDELKFAVEFAKSVQCGQIITKSAFDLLTKEIPNQDYPLDKFKVDYDHDMKRLEHENIIRVMNLLQANQCTNTTYYCRKSFMGWHTNSNNIGKRTYITYSLEPAIFKYYDYNTQQVEIDYDFKGWTQREFMITSDNLFWHCVYAPSMRFAYGFNTHTV